MKFITRSEWGARPPKSTPASINSEGTTGHWEGGGIWSGVIGDHASCATKVRAIQAYHMDHQGWSDIAYNALGCPHGYVFEGRGPSRRSAANGTNTANGKSAVVCYLGGVGDPFTAEGKQAMLDAAIYLLADLIWGHRDWYSTQCPGEEIWTWIHSGPPMPEPGPIPDPPTQSKEYLMGASGKTSNGEYRTYVVKKSTGQIWETVFSSGGWKTPTPVPNGNVQALAPNGLSGFVDGNRVDLFAISASFKQYHGRRLDVTDPNSKWVWEELEGDYS